jgi:erythromycin esterase-like protein
MKKQAQAMKMNYGHRAGIAGWPLLKLGNATLRLAGRRTTMLLCSAVAAVAWSGCGGERYGQEVRPLRPDETVERRLAPDELHSYLTELGSGDFVRVVIESEGIGVEARVFRPRTIEPSFTVVHWGATFRGPLILSVQAADAGVYRLEVRRTEDTQLSQSGRYVLHIDELVGAEKYLGRQAALADDRRVAWLREHAIPVRSLSAADEDLSDLESLKDIFHGVRIVMLGSSTYADGASFLAMSRLTKLLHRELGFDILAFSGGLYDCWKAWQFLKQGEDPYRAASRCGAGNWTNSEQVQALLDYLGEAARSDRPLQLWGYDSQFIGPASREFLITDLTAFLDEQGIDTSAFGPGSASRTIFQKLVEAAYWGTYWEGGKTEPLPGAHEQEELLHALNRVREELMVKARVREPAGTAFWSQVLSSVTEFVRYSFLMFSAPDLEETWDAVVDIRDPQMTKNLLWIARDRFPQRKIIVWATAPRIARNPEQIDPRSSLSTKPIRPTLGRSVWEALGEEAYALGFTAYQGQYGLARHSGGPRFDIMPDQDRAAELEELLHAAGFQHAFLDFRRLPPAGSWLREPIFSRVINHRAMKADWTQVLDGVWFHREMTPATYVERE